MEKEESMQRGQNVSHRPQPLPAAQVQSENQARSEDELILDMACGCGVVNSLGISHPGSW